MESATATRPAASGQETPERSGAADRAVAQTGGRLRAPAPVNEPVLSYGPMTSEREEIKERLSLMSSEIAEIPVIIGGEEIRTGDVQEVVMPHDHGHVLATWHAAGDAEIERAIRAAHQAWTGRPYSSGPPTSSPARGGQP
jgi:hypothetical protein